MSIASYLENTQEVFLAIPPREFERRLKQITHAETLENMPGVIIKLDPENYPEKYVGNIEFNQFAIRPVFKESQKTVYMQIEGSYQTHQQGTTVTYTVKPLRKKMIAWIGFLTMAFLFSTVATLSMPLSNFMRMYLLIGPLLFFAFIALSPFRASLKPTLEGFEQDLRSFELPQAPSTSLMDTITTPKKSSSRVFIVFALFGLPFLLIGLNFGQEQYTFYQNATAKTEGTVIALKFGSKGSKAPIFSYSTANGTTYKDTSNVYSSPPQYRIGEKVVLYYDPFYPETARPKSILDTWLFPSVFTLAGLLMEMLAFFGFLNRTKD